MKFFFSYLWILMIVSSCQDSMNVSLDIQGHRGCRGTLPENTIPAFLEACRLGVTTLEMDVVLTKDGVVIVSHEAFFNPVFTTPPTPISENEIASLNIFQMNYADVKSYDVGIKQNPRFPHQRAVACTKPTLEEVITLCQKYPVNFNIEIKRTPEGDGVFHPEPEIYVQRVVDVLEKLNVLERTILQSFDIETLQIIRKKRPDIPLALLCEDQWATVDSKIKKLGFVPDIYSPHYKKITIPLIRYCHKLGMKIIPWTVNHPFVMRKLIRWKVDGIITDFPEKLLDIVEKS